MPNNPKSPAHSAFITNHAHMRDEDALEIYKRQFGKSLSIDAYRKYRQRLGIARPQGGSKKRSAKKVRGKA